MSAATILTLANGRGIDLLAPRAEDIDFAVMGEHLAKENRYNGATPNLVYSVAEHCVRGADSILEATGADLLAAYFLLHDGHEHTLKDDTTPKKRALAELAQERFGILAVTVLAAFDDLTDRHDAAIHEAAGLAWPPSTAIADSVKYWDITMFVTEWRDLMKGVPHPNWLPYAEVPPIVDMIEPWPWYVARARFIERCEQLLPALKGRRVA